MTHIKIAAIPGPNERTSSSLGDLLTLLTVTSRVSNNIGKVGVHCCVTQWDSPAADSHKPSGTLQVTPEEFAAKMEANPSTIRDPG